MTWYAIRAGLARRWLVDRNESAWLGLLVEGCRVVAQPAHGGAARLVLTTRVGAASAFDPVIALRYNGAHDHGSLGIDGDAVVLRLVIPWALDELAVDECLTSLAREANRLRALTAPR